MKRTTLPARAFLVDPAFIRGRRIGIGVCIVMIALMAALSIYCAFDVIAMRREAAIWENGEPTEDASVDGTSRVKFVFVDYKLRVRYVAPDGEHTGLQEFATIGGGANMHISPSLRYDRDHPDDFATSWGIEATAGRWRWILVIGGFGAFVIAVMVLQVRRSRREIARTRAIASTGSEVIATIDSVTAVTLSNGRATPHIKVTWRTTDRGPFTTQIDTRRGGVAWTIRDREAVALISDDGAAGVLLRDDLYPLVATEPEIEAAAASRRGLAT